HLMGAPGSKVIDSRGRFGQAALAQAPGVHRGNDRRADLGDDVLAREAPSDTERVASRDQGEDATFGDAKLVTQAAHLESVGDREALESKLASEEVGHDPAA